MNKVEFRIQDMQFSLLFTIGLVNLIQWQLPLVSHALIGQGLNLNSSKNTDQILAFNSSPPPPPPGTGEPDNRSGTGGRVTGTQS